MTNISENRNLAQKNRKSNKKTNKKRKIHLFFNKFPQTRHTFMHYIIIICCLLFVRIASYISCFTIVTSSSYFLLAFNLIFGLPKKKHRKRKKNLHVLVDTCFSVTFQLNCFRVRLRGLRVSRIHVAM